MSRPVVTVTTGPTSTSVAQNSVIEAEPGMPTDQDTRVNRIIAAVGAAFEAELDRPPWRQVYSEQLPGDGGIFLSLSRWPVESVASITPLNGTAVTASEYSIGQHERSRIYRENGWTHHKPTKNGMSGSGAKELGYTAAYTAGWLMPGEITTWVASTAYAGSGEVKWVRPTDTTAVLVFEAGAEGDSAATEPTWPTTIGGAVVDNDITWTAREAREMPLDFQEAAIMQVVEWFRGGLNLPAGVKSERYGPIETVYKDVLNGAGGLAPHVASILRRYK